jgi:PAS domain S-box-containing protein
MCYEYPIQVRSLPEPEISFPGKPAGRNRSASQIYLTLKDLQRGRGLSDLASRAQKITEPHEPPVNPMEKITLEKRIILFAFLILTLAISINAGLSIQGFRKDFRDSIVLRSRSLAAGLQSSIENVLALGVPLGEMEGINARCQEIVATDPDIVYCLIEDASGKPIYASDPSFEPGGGRRPLPRSSEPAAALDFPQWGKVYDTSVPLFSADGRSVGRIRIGFPEGVLDQHTMMIFQRSLLVLGGGFLLIFSLVALFLKRDIVRPIGKLRSVAMEIAGGNFSINPPAMPSRDFEELAGALGEMAASLRERDEKILENYHDLEEANLLLKKFSEQQELISADLKRSREMYQVLFDQASDAILVSDKEDRIILFNKKAEEFFGISSKRVEGENLFQTIDLAEGDLDLQYRLYQVLLERGYQETEFRYVRPGENRSTVGWMHASVIRSSQGSFWVQIIIRDITQERETKENLEESGRELERLNQMKNSFLGVASHELKTPLTVILGYSDLVLGEMKDRVDPSVLGMIRYIAEAAERLSDIVRDMLDVSMLDSREVELVKRPVDVNDLVRGSARDLETFFRQRRQRLEIKLGENVPEIQGDPERLAQVIANLLNNAFKFTPDGGSVSVETRLLGSLRSPDAEPIDGGMAKKIDDSPSPYVEIIVRDNGIGIAEKDQLHVFDKFFDAGRIEEHFTGKFTFKGKGAGLGLSIAQGIVNKHHGEIWVESPGYDPQAFPGSSFHVLLPVSPIARGADPGSA